MQCSKWLGGVQLHGVQSVSGWSRSAPDCLPVPAFLPARFTAASSAASLWRTPTSTTTTLSGPELVLTQCYASLPTTFLLPAAITQHIDFDSNSRAVDVHASVKFYWTTTMTAEPVTRANRCMWYNKNSASAASSTYSKLSSTCSLWHRYGWATYCTIQSFSASSTSRVVRVWGCRTLALWTSSIGHFLRLPQLQHKDSLTLFHTLSLNCYFSKLFTFKGWGISPGTVQWKIAGSRTWRVSPA